MFGFFNRSKSVEQKPIPTDVVKPMKKEFDGEILCIYCYKKFPANEVCFRCPKDRYDAEATSHRCVYQVDEKLNRYRERMGGNPSTDPMARVIELSEIPSGKIVYDRVRSSVVSRIECDCGRDLNEFHRVCPHCHNRLIRAAGYKEVKMISVVGASAVGKSNYILMLAKEFEKVASMYNLSFTVLHEYSGENLYKKWVANLKKHEIIERTSVFKETFEPVIIAELGFADDRPKIVFVFHDIPGELFRNIDNTRDVEWKGNFVNYSDGIIFLLDPMQIENLSGDLRNVVEGMFFEHDIENLPSDIIQNMERNCQGIKEGTRITIPTAITIAKSDVLIHLDKINKLESSGVFLGKDANIFRPCNHDKVKNGKLRKQEINDIKKEVSDFINNVDKAFYKIAESYFKNHSFFAVSAFGKNPYDEVYGEKLVTPRINGDPEPKRVEEPLLWLLYMMGIIDME